MHTSERGVSGGRARRLEFAPVPSGATQVAVKVRDGVRLASDVYLPRGVSRGWPVILMRTPYDKAGTGYLYPEIAEWLTDHGYAVVLQDTRGKVRSEGDAMPFRHEESDAYDTIDWIAQQRWCSGSVGMLGESYDGYVEWAATASAHPALRAIVPQVTTPDFAAEFALDGVFRLAWVAGWLGHTYVDEALYDIEPDWNVRPLCDIVPSALGGRRLPMLDEWASGMVANAPVAQVGLQVPALHIGGWWDLFRRGQVRTWRLAHARHPLKHFLRMDVRDHNWSHLERATAAPDPSSIAAHPSSEYLDELLTPVEPFLDRFVRGSAKAPPPTVRWRSGWGEWSTATSWPPPTTRPLTLYSTSSRDSAGRLHLAPSPDRRSEAVRWQHDPHDPVPSLADAYGTLTNPPNDRLLDRRADIVRFIGSSTTAPLHLAGPIEFTVEAASTARSLHVMVKLLDVDSGGESTRIAEGAACAHEPWPAIVRVDLGDAAYVVHVGHALRLDISSSAFPEYELHPGTDRPAWRAEEFRINEQTITVGGPQGARLVVWILPRESGAA